MVGPVPRALRPGRQRERRGRLGHGGRGGRLDGTRALEDGEVAEFAENSSKKRRRHHRKGDLKVHFPVWIEEDEDTGRDRRPLHFIVELEVPMPANLYLPAPVRAGDRVGVRVQSLALGRSWTGGSSVCTTRSGAVSSQAASAS